MECPNLFDAPSKKTLCFCVVVFLFVAAARGKTIYNLPTDNVVLFETTVSGAIDSNIYLSCQQNKAVLFIPTARLRGFPRNTDLPSTSFAVSDQNCPATKKTINSVVGIEIVMPFDACGPGLMWVGDSLVYHFPRHFSYVAGDDIYYQVPYLCKYPDGDRMRRAMIDKQNPWFNLPASPELKQCSTLTNDFVLPSIADLTVDLVLTAHSNETRGEARIVTFDGMRVMTVTMDEAYKTIRMPSGQGNNNFHGTARAKGMRVTTGDAVYQGVAVVQDIPSRKRASFAVLPTCAWGTEYVIVTYHSLRSFVIMTAIAQDTMVTIRCDGDDERGGQQIYSLSALQTINVRRSSVGMRCPLSGAHVTSNKPISVVSVSDDAKVPFIASERVTRDIMAEQLLPVSAWGSEYVINPSNSHFAGHILVVAVFKNPVQMMLWSGNETTGVTVEPFRPLEIDLRSGERSILRSTDDSVFLALLIGKSGKRVKSRPRFNYFLRAGIRDEPDLTIAPKTSYPFMSSLAPTSSYINVHAVSRLRGASMFVSLATSNAKDLRVLGFPISDGAWIEVSNSSHMKVAEQPHPSKTAVNLFYMDNASLTFGSQVYTRTKWSSSGHVGAMVFFKDTVNATITRPNAASLAIAHSPPINSFLPRSKNIMGRRTADIPESKIERHETVFGCKTEETAKCQVNTAVTDHMYTLLNYNVVLFETTISVTSDRNKYVSCRENEAVLFIPLAELWRFPHEKDLSSVLFAVSDRDCPATKKTINSVVGIEIVMPFDTCGSGLMCKGDKNVYEFPRRISYVEENCIIYDLNYTCTYPRDDEKCSETIASCRNATSDTVLSYTPPADNIVHFEKYISGANDANIYLSCRENEAVLFIPVAQLLSFPADQDLLSVLFAVSDRDCPVTKKSINSVVGIEIVMPFDTCGSGLMLEGDEKVYRFPRRISYVTESYFTYDLTYTCKYPRDDEKCSETTASCGNMITNPVQHYNLSTDNIVHFEKHISEANDANIYLSCRENEAVLFIPVAQLLSFPADHDLLSVLFAVSDRDCPVTKKIINSVVGIEIMMPFDTCGPGSMLEGDEKVYRFPRRISYVTESYFTYDLPYTCKHSSVNEKCSKSTGSCGNMTINPVQHYNLSTDNIVHFEKHISEANDANIYLSCRENEAVIFIPVAQLLSFPADKELLSVLFAVSDRDCPSTRKTINSVVGIEIMMPFDTCGPGLVLEGDEKVYRFPRRISYVTESYFTYDLPYTCKYPRNAEKCSETMASCGNMTTNPVQHYNLSTDNVVHFEKHISEANDANIYLSCRENEAVLFIPVAQLLSFPADQDLSSILFAVSDRDCPVTKKIINSVVGIEIVMPFDTCGSGLMDVGDKEVYQFPRRISYVVESYFTYDLRYVCKYPRVNKKCSNKIASCRNITANPVQHYTLPADNIVHFEKYISGANDANIYISCRENEAVLFIPVAQLLSFPAGQDLLSVLFAVSDRDCPVTKKTINFVVGIEIMMPFDTCGPGLMWFGESLIYHFPRRISYVTSSYFTYDVPYKCEFPKGNKKRRTIVEKRERWPILSKPQRPECSSFTNEFLLPAIASLRLSISLTARDNETRSEAQLLLFDNTFVGTVTIDEPTHTIGITSHRQEPISSTPRANGLRILTRDAFYHGVAVIEDKPNRQAASFAVLPTCAWDTQYVVMTYPGSKFFVVVTALQRNTTVQLTCGSKKTARFDISELESIYLNMSNTAALGCSWPAAHVTANRPISVVSVSMSAKVPVVSQAPLTEDIIAEQLLPVSSWGSEYVINPESSHKSGYLLLIMTHKKPVHVMLTTGSQSTKYLVKPFRYVEVDFPSNQSYVLKSSDNSVFLAAVIGKSGVYAGETTTRSFPKQTTTTPDYPFMSLLMPTSSYLNVHSVAADWEAEMSVNIVTENSEDFFILGLPTSPEVWSKVVNASRVQVSKQPHLTEKQVTVYYMNNATNSFGSLVYAKRKQAVTGHLGAMKFVRSQIQVTTTAIPTTSTVVKTSSTSTTKGTTVQVGDCDFCKNGGTCRKTEKSFKCACPLNFAGLRCNETAILMSGNYYLTTDEGILDKLFPGSSDNNNGDVGATASSSAAASSTTTTTTSTTTTRPTTTMTTTRPTTTTTRPTTTTTRPTTTTTRPTTTTTRPTTTTTRPTTTTTRPTTTTTRPTTTTTAVFPKIVEKETESYIYLEKRSATGGLEVELVFLGSYYAIRNRRGCPAGPTCLHWLHVLEKQNVTFVNPNSGYHTWNLLLINATTQTYHIQSAVHGMYLSYAKGEFVLKIENEATKFVFERLADQTKSVSSAKYRSFPLIDIRSQLLGESLSGEIAETSAVRDNATDYTSCFWYKKHRGSFETFPAIKIDALAVLRQMTLDVTSRAGCFVLQVDAEIIGRSETFTLPDHKYWHHFCLRRTSKRLSLFLDGFRLPWKWFHSRKFFKKPRERPKFAYCSKFAGGSCFSGYMHSVAIWSRPLDSTQIHNLYSALSACGIRNFEPNRIVLDLLFAGVETENHDIIEVTYPICACKYCPWSWSLSGDTCFRLSDLRGGQSFIDYFQGRVCHPASATDASHRVAIGSMIDAVQENALQGAYYGLQKKKGSRTFEFHNGIAVSTRRPAPLDLCGVARGSINRAHYATNWPAKVPGKLPSPRSVEFSIQYCVTKRPVICQKNATDFSSSQPIDLIFVISDTGNFRARVRDVVSFMVRAARAEIIEYRFYVFSRDKPYFAFNLNNFSPHIPRTVHAAQIISSPEEDFRNLLGVMRKNLYPGRRSFIVLITSVAFDVTGEMISSKWKKKDVSFFALGFNEIDPSYLKSLATHPDFVHQISDHGIASDLEISFRRFLCGVTGMSAPVVTTTPVPPLSPLQPRSGSVTDSSRTTASTLLPPDVARSAQLECTHLGMTVQISHASLKNSLEMVPDDNFRVAVHFRDYENDKTCGTTRTIVNSTGHQVYSLFVSVPFVSCQLAVDHFRDLSDQTEINVSGLLYVTESSSKKSIGYDRQIAKVSCTYGADFTVIEGVKTVSSAIVPIVNESRPAEVKRISSIKIDFLSFADVNMKQPWSPAASVAIGRKLYMLINVAQPIPKHKELLVKSCVASPSSIPTVSPKNLQLISNNCPIDSVIAIEVHNLTRTSLLFSLPAFRWPGEDLRPVYLHCDAEACDNIDEACTRTCSELSSPKQKRSIATGPSSSQNVISTSFRAVQGIKLAITSKPAETMATLTLASEANRKQEENISESPNSTYPLSYICRYPYHLMALLFFTLLFFSVVIIVVVVSSKKQSLGEIARHSSSQYVKGASVSDAENSCILTTAQALTGSNNNNSNSLPPCDLLTRSTASAFGVAATVVPEAASSSGRSVLLREIARGDDIFPLKQAALERPGGSKRVRPFSTFLGSSSTIDSTSTPALARPKSLLISKHRSGTAGTGDDTRARRTKVGFEGVSVDHTAM